MARTKKTPIEAVERPYAATFYQEQMELAEAGIKTAKDRTTCEAYKDFVNWLYEGEEDIYPGPYHRPLSFRDPMTYPQYCKILKEFSKEQIKEQVQSMQNYDSKDFWGKRVSFYLTMLDWLRSRKPRQQYNNQPEKPTFASTPKRVGN